MNGKTPDYPTTDAPELLASGQDTAFTRLIEALLALMASSQFERETVEELHDEVVRLFRLPG
ncbi:MAG: hypothetical protein L0287_01240 [Anaerolineae bacterium]|nr:hypothetical protein [Anaerolineae bacterium]